MKLINVKNPDYDEYEKIIFERDKLKKEALKWEVEYVNEFGDLIVAGLQKKVEAIEDKGSSEFREETMRLKQFSLENEAVKAREVVDAQKEKEIEELYKKLAKQIHADINPMTDENAELKMIWIDVIIAYNANKLKDLKDAEELLGKIVEDKQLEEKDVEISDIAGKIDEIQKEMEEIKTTEPYIFKEILEDEVKKEQRRKELSV